MEIGEAARDPFRLLEYCWGCPTRDTVTNFRTSVSSRPLRFHRTEEYSAKPRMTLFGFLECCQRRPTRNTIYELFELALVRGALRFHRIEKVLSSPLNLIERSVDFEKFGESFESFSHALIDLSALFFLRFDDFHVNQVSDAS